MNYGFRVMISIMRDYCKRVFMVTVLAIVMPCSMIFHISTVSGQANQTSAAWVAGVWFINGFNSAVASATNMGSQAVTICFDIWAGNNGTTISRYCSADPIPPQAAYAIPYYVTSPSGSPVATILAYSKGGTVPIIAWGYVMNIQNNVAVTSASLTWTPAIPQS